MWHLGLCPICTKRTYANKYGKAALYLDHISDIVHYIKENHPTLKVIIWDDMIRSMDINILKGKHPRSNNFQAANFSCEDYNMGQLVEPMVWHYNSSETFGIDGRLWDKYSNVFKNVWGATAFKGATATCQIIPVNKYHISNHEAWLSNLALHAGKIINFRGIALTGWSR